AAIGQPLGPQPFTVQDVVKIATLVGGIFGNGGGQQLSNAILYENLKQQFGPERVNVAGSPELISQPASKKHKPKKRKGKGKPGKKKTAADAVAARTGRRHRGVRPGTKRAGKAGLGAGRLTNIADTSGFATFLSLVDPSDPEAPTTVRSQ